MRTLFLTLITCLFVLPAYAKYSGGTGEPNDPYQIATAEDLMLLGETPEDYGKHFLLTADIDLDPNLPGRKVFDKAVIAPDTNDANWWFEGTPFTGFFDGNGRTISNLIITGGGHRSYIGLFGQLGEWSSSVGEVKDLGVVDVKIAGSSYSGFWVGGLVGYNDGSIFTSYSTGVITGGHYVGGLVGENHGRIAMSCSSGSVTGDSRVGGLIGMNHYGGSVTHCYSSGMVSGNEDIGGLVGETAYGTVTNCYNTGAVSGRSYVGGLVGYNFGGTVIESCYSTGAVSGNWCVGGLVGGGQHVTNCFWDIQTSGQATSAGGTGKTTDEMHDIRTYQDAGWDFMGETKDGLHEIWRLPEGGNYPVLAILSGYIPPQLLGLGTPDDPYLISDALELGAMIYYRPDTHYRLSTSLDLSGIRWGMAVIPRFEGTFDGNGHTILHLTIKGADYLGLFGQLESGAEVRDLGVVDVNVTGNDYVGGLVGYNSGSIATSCSSGSVTGDSRVGGLIGSNHYGIVTQCYSSGSVKGSWSVGGLVGYNSSGIVTQCFSTGAVSGDWTVGGLVGRNDESWYTESIGTLTGCYSAATVSGTGDAVGGLVGENVGEVINCYSTSTASGDSSVGGLIGVNLVSWLEPRPPQVYYYCGLVDRCYSTGAVSGSEDVGGLVGSNTDDWSNEGVVTYSFWDKQTSGQAGSAGGTGKTTAQMQTTGTFLESGWDFVGETANGTEDIWWILEGQDHPRLWWELIPGN